MNQNVKINQTMLKILSFQTQFKKSVCTKPKLLYCVRIKLSNKFDTEIYYWGNRNE